MRQCLVPFAIAIASVLIPIASHSACPGKVVRASFQELRNTHRDITLRQPSALEDQTYWEADTAVDVERYPYDREFGQLWGSRTFEKFLLDRKNAGKSNHLLDLFGSGGVDPQNMSYDSMTGVRLSTAGDLQNPRQRVLQGNLFSPRTWRLIASSLKQRDIPHIDVATIRPLAGMLVTEMSMGHTQEYRQIYFRMIQRTYDLLNRTEGEIFVQMPLSYNLRHWNVWRRQLEEHGILADATQTDGPFARVYINIQRRSGSASALPIPLDLVAEAN